MPVKFIQCPIYQTPQGKLLKYLQANHDDFDNFGESYFSWLNPGLTKGWYKHKKFQSYITSPTCNLHIAVFNEEESFEFKLTSNNYGYIVIPNGYYYAMKSLDQSPALIVNTLNHAYQDHEIEKKDINLFESWFINA